MMYDRKHFCQVSKLPTKNILTTKKRTKCGIPHTVLQATNTQLRQEECVYTAGGHLVEHKCELLISFLLLGDVLLKVIHFCIHATHLLLLVTGGGERGGRREREEKCDV